MGKKKLSQKGSVHKRSVEHHRHGKWGYGLNANENGTMRQWRVCGEYISCRYTQVLVAGKWVKDANLHSSH